VSRPYVPQPVLDAAHARSAARAAREWATADRLRDEIEAAGWRVVDRGTDFRLEPLHPPDLSDEAGVRYGRSEAVPSRLYEPSTRRATVVLIATDQPDDLDRALAALGRTVPAGTQLVVVADAPDAAQADRLPVSAPPGDAAAIEGYLLAVGRADAAAAGPLDEGFRFYRNLDIWWSLVLRDRGEGMPPRRAAVVAGLPLLRHEHRGWTSVPEAERDRLSKRNFYRFLDRFRDRLDLAVP